MTKAAMIAKLEEDIARQKRIIFIRESYSAVNEGYPQRTAALRRELAIDERKLSELKSRKRK